MPQNSLWAIFLKIRRTEKKREKKEIWLSQGIYVYSRIEIIMVMIITEKRNRWGKEIEQIKQEFFINSIKLANQSSELSKNENNDCVVRAFMCALDLSYDQAHAWVKKELNRIDRKGTLMNAYSKNIIGKTKNGKKISFMGAHPSREYMNFKFGSNKPLVNTKYKKLTGYTLKSFIENNPVGRFVLIVQGHAVAVINGVLYGNQDEQYNGLYRSVWFGFEMK
jgi:hypothetical protein